MNTRPSDPLPSPAKTTLEEDFAEEIPSETDFKLAVDGFKGTPEEIDRLWYAKVFKGRGDTMRQLTWRAVLMGSVLGSVLSLTNLYIGLKTGWGMGVAITACILSYAIWNGLCAIGLARSKMTILENNCMQSTASSAGFSTGITLISAYSAYLMLGNPPMPLPILLCWVFFLAVLGVTMAIPMKRQMINHEQLRFPSGIAAAETLQALHSRGGRGRRAGRALGLSGLLAAVSTFWADGLRMISPRLNAWSVDTLFEKGNAWLLGSDWIGRTVKFPWDPIFVAAGAITGIRVCGSMLLGGSLCWMVYVPILQQHGVITGTGFREIVQWSLWVGVSCMVTSGLFSFALSWRSAWSALRDVAEMFRPNGARQRSEMAAIETPASWFVVGQAVSIGGLAWMGHVTFGMPYWQTFIAWLLSFGLALVSCRVTGETDTTPIGPLGKVTQLVFGAISPGNTNINLMSAYITAGAAGSSADLLTDLKSGYLLGANPRQQFIAQFLGIFAGTVVTVLCFNIMVPDPSVLGSEQFPAPAAQTWKAVAVALSKGFATLGPVKIGSIIAGGLLGIVLPLLSLLFPKHHKYIPSAAGFGLAWAFQWSYSYLFFMGALIGLVLARKAPKTAEEFTFPVASGVIAGGSLMGVLLIFLKNGPEAIRKLLGG